MRSHTDTIFRSRFRTSAAVTSPARVGEASAGRNLQTRYHDSEIAVFTQPQANPVLGNSPDRALAATPVSEKAATVFNSRQIEPTEMIGKLA